MSELEYIQKDGYCITNYRGASLKLDGSYEDFPAVLNYLSKYTPKKGDIIVDAGAYIGAFAILVSPLIGNEGKIIAFEPDRDNYRRLLYNIKLNNITNIITINKGLWSKDALLEFNHTCTGDSSFFFDPSALSSVLRIPVANLSEELKRLGIKKVDFIKMDIEGAELEAIQGAKNLLKKNKVNLAIASYHIVNGKETRFSVEKNLKKIGYKVQTLFPEHFTTYASKEPFGLSFIKSYKRKLKSLIPLVGIKKNWRNFLFWLSEKLSYPFVPPDLLQLCFTFRCNIRCKMCNMDAKIQEFRKLGKPYELSIPLMRDLILQAHKMKIKMVYFVGGEPFLEKDIFNLVEYANNLGMDTSINTNGILLGPDKVDNVFTSGLSHLTFSIDGPDKETHDQIRGENIFERSVANLTNIIAERNRRNLTKPNLSILCTVMRQNIAKLVDIVVFAKNLGVSVLFQPVVPDNTDQSHDFNSSTWIGPDIHNVLDKTVDKLLEMKNSREFSPYMGSSFQQIGLMKSYFRGDFRNHRKCYIGFSRLVVTQDRKIYFCVDDPKTGEMTFGDVLDTPLLGLWKSKEARKFRKYIKKCKRPCLLGCSYREEFDSSRDALSRLLKYFKIKK
ncbi:MAG: FkbM family methyltransferase [Candidatus Omnitrophica bacterium]|jgi:FkbM family methyltransferase|nr:FkbM family methyltransferase [Candidatus Omnitrophota bacterium]